MTLDQRLIQMVDRSAASRLTAAATALLEQDPAFRSAFPSEASRRSNVATPSLARQIQACLDDPVVLKALPARGASTLSSLLELPCDAVTRLTPPQVQSLATELVDTATRLGSVHGASATAELRAGQIAWLEGDDVLADRRFANSEAQARTCRESSSALLHRGLLYGDRARLDDALALLFRAAALRPGHLAAHWTIAVYATVTRQSSAAAPHWRAAMTVGTHRAIRARALSLERHFAALADRGLEHPERARRHSGRMFAEATHHVSAGVLA
ncbi:MAG: hypothetical protein EXS13_14930 [Planctomycetes bacterium]|nr:hypothetical protein [Planctomycetota bacterium]